MKLFRTNIGPVVLDGDRYFQLPGVTWDHLVSRGDLLAYLRQRVAWGHLPPAAAPTAVLAPIDSQEVWAAGVTYLRSREARMEESNSAGGGDFYDRVYEAERPELFFKATSHRVAGPGQPVRIRADSKWNVPEPELTLLVSASGRITGYTIGNDMSSRDIEGENPLYLPQAKVYDGCCALGPCIFITDTPLPPDTAIEIQIRRDGGVVFEGKTSVGRIKRPLELLVEFLYRESSFPRGCFLLTGTGVVPPNEFTLRQGDDVEIDIEPIGTLNNPVQSL